MCGIVGYTGSRPCREILLTGLEKLEYRGYDSAGISLLEDGQVLSVRAVGNLSRLRQAVGDDGIGAAALAGIGHTRWATHGRVTEANAHPHDDGSGRVHVVLNGIVENWVELRRVLEADGVAFSSETDAEAVAHLIASHYDGDLVAAVRAAYGQLRGHYAFVAVHADEPDTLVAARKECPLVVGVGEGESFVASAIPAFMRDTRRVQLVENDEIVVITPAGATFTTVAGEAVERSAEEIDWVMPITRSRSSTTGSR
jgi:glucosamine--fructose-6-phosphate aminotransferase (isomerizing)